jgi:DNA-binding FrmR family transcriptional regulator
MGEINKQDITRKLNIVGGQLRGIEKLLADKENYTQALQQLEAIRSGVVAIESKVIEELLFERDWESREEIIGYIQKIIR